jgi:hypothetical protein
VFDDLPLQHGPGGGGVQDGPVDQSVDQPEELCDTNDS